MSKPYTTPGVYVTEVSTLPPSIVQVATAIPAFIGYVKTALDDNGKPIDLSKYPVVRRISSMLDYQNYFGGSASLVGTVTKTTDPKTNAVSYSYATATTAPVKSFYLYYAVQHFYANGGGDAYIIAVGDYSAAPAESKFTDGIAKAAELDEVTLLLAPEAVQLSTYYQKVVGAMLQQANNLGDRFVLIDTVPAANNKPADAATALRDASTGITGVTDIIKYGAAYYPNLNTALAFDVDPTQITLNGFTAGTLDGLNKAAAEYNVVMALLAQQTPTLPPSAAIAGVYAQTDAARGVWKAPANVPLAAVNGPSVIVTAEQQGPLNVDPGSGKSINVIRSFTGQGSLVWGAR
ncbi:phage tail sheath subtilisin-like domain-containing protein, partial [Pseudogulbenkiania ferrooxidans]